MALDTRWWNLALGVATAAMAGCGPTIVLSDTDGLADDGDSVDDGADDAIDPPDDDGLPPPPLPNCSSNAQCEANQICEAGVCVNDGYNDDSYHDDNYDDDYHDDYYDDDYHNDDYYMDECFAADDCFEGEFCQDYQCIPLPYARSCSGAELPDLSTSLNIEVADSPVVSLAFVDADADTTRALLIGQADGTTTLHRSTGVAPTGLVLPPDSTVTAATSADFNGDSVPDLALGLAGATTGVTMMLGNGDGTFTLGVTAVTDTPESMAVLDYNLDGFADLALQAGETVAVFQGAGDGSFVDQWTMTNDTTGPMQVGRAVEAAPLALFAGDLSSVRRWDAGDPPGQVGVDEFDHEQGAPWQPLSGATEFEHLLLGYRNIVGGTHVRTAEGIQVFVPGLTELARTGDIDGDIDEDFVFANGTQLTVLVHDHALAAPMCQETLDVIGSESVTLGDFDGDGSANIAVTDGTLVVMYGSE